MTIAMTLGAVILVSLFSLYYVAAASASKEESRQASVKEGRMVAMRMVRDLRLVGLFATEDIDGDSNDIDHDIPGISWNNGLHEALEYATTYSLVFSCDVDNDSTTETIGLWRNDEGVQQDIWEWQRDSVEWSQRTARVIGRNVDALLFRYYDKNGNEIPSSGPIPVGGYTLTTGQRFKVASIEMTIVTRSDQEEQGHYQEYTSLPDGTYWYDNHHREVYRFLVAGRNLGLGA
ncbi:MAG: hypothetical protein H6506_00095 [Calditrichaeota bacterium]|nr:hypothetical protein [Calditrichota bacterium]MCB9391039.1 hypothetical protein [Calditrichota bacterium]